MASPRPFVLGALLGLVALMGCGADGGPTPGLLVLERTIPLKGVAGRIDHLAVDLKAGRLFVAELGNGSVDGVDLATGQSVRIAGLKEPQGVAYLAASQQLAIASGGDGAVRFYRGADLAPIASLKVGEDADNLRVDSRTGQLVVGYGDGGLAVIDPGAHTVLKRLALPAHPEGFRLDGDRVWVNLPDANAIVAADLRSGQVTATWKAAHKWNFPMALDAASGALAVVYRLPSRLVVQDAATGALRSDIATCGDADDVFFDAKRSRIYVACGSGAVDVMEKAGGGYRLLSRVKTRSGARTALWVPELDRLFVAARGADAAILVYRPQP